MSKKQVKIITKNSKSKGNVPSDLEYGELAINYADKKLFFKDDEDKINSVDLLQPFAEAEDGAAKSAKKLTTNAGSTTQPVYFTDGKPSACTHSLNETVPPNAKFTDTTYSAGTGLSLSDSTFNHTNSVTAVTDYQGSSTTAGANAGAVDVISGVKYDAQGHVTGVQKKSITLSNTTYDASNGIKLDGTTFKHTNSVTAREQVGENSNIEPTFGEVINIPCFDHDAEGHITKSGTTKIQLPKSTASTTATGLMSADDKINLNTLLDVHIPIVVLPSDVLSEAMRGISIPITNYFLDYIDDSGLAFKENLYLIIDDKILYINKDKSYKITSDSEGLIINSKYGYKKITIGFMQIGVTKRLYLYASDIQLNNVFYKDFNSFDPTTNTILLTPGITIINCTVDVDGAKIKFITNKDGIYDVYFKFNQPTQLAGGFWLYLNSQKLVDTYIKDKTYYFKFIIKDNKTILSFYNELTNVVNQ